MKRLDLFYFLLIAGVLSYIVARSISIPITYDEAWTWSQVIEHSYSGIVSYKEYMIANNHVLNSLWVKFCFTNFGYNTFSFRILSIIGGAIYLVFSCLIVSHIRSTFIKIISCVLLFFQPFILDYFSLARGYGLAIGLLMGSLYFTLLFIKNLKIKYLTFSTICILCSAIVNFGFVYVFISIVFINVVLKIQFDKVISHSFFSSNFLLNKVFNLIPEVFSFLVFVFYIYPIGKELSKESYLLASDAGLIKGTFASLLYGIIYHVFDGIKSVVIKLIFIEVFIVSLFLPLFAGKKITSDVAGKYFLYLIIVATAVCIIIQAQHIITHSRFPIERGVMYFIPILLLIVVFSADFLNNFLVNINVSFMAISTIILFLFSFGFTDTFTWKRQVHDIEVADKVLSITKKLGYKKSVIITDDGSFSLDYYMRKLANGNATVIHAQNPASVVCPVKKDGSEYFLYYSAQSAVTSSTGADYSDTGTHLRVCTE